MRIYSDSGEHFLDVLYIVHISSSFRVTAQLLTQMNYPNSNIQQHRKYLLD